jgi:lipoprotein-anchoring transpeptidase ErfK/SrfK
MRMVCLLLGASVLAGCGANHHAAPARVLAAKVVRCAAGEVRPLGSTRLAYVGVATRGAIVRQGARSIRFGAHNVNGYPTIFGVTGAVVDRSCKTRSYRVELPLKPNGQTGLVSAHALEIQTVQARIEVDVSARRLTLFRAGRAALVATVAVGSSATPTPTGRYYVNQRLVPSDPNGPYGPGAIGISAFSNVLTGWAQGGPVAIHGTNEPWSIGRAVSNGCIRLPNATLRKLFRVAVAGTPVIIHG